MASIDSPAGGRFRADLDETFRTCERLIRVLVTYRPGTGGAPMDLPGLRHYLTVLQHGDLRWVPPHVDIPPAEKAQFEAREAIRERWSKEALGELGGYPDEDYLVADQAIRRWALKAMLSRPKPRFSSRRITRRYLNEMQTLAQRWRLEAWWAVPALVLQQLNVVRFREALLSGLVTHEASSIDRLALIARLPGTSDEEFERDAQRFALLRVAQKRHTDGGPVRVVWRPRQAELDAIAADSGAACVVLDWSPFNEPDPASRLVQQCEARLSRPLSSYEERRLRTEIDSQVQAAKEHFMKTGYEPADHADRQEQATLVARRLLDPSQSWASIAGGVDLGPAVQRKCRDFARAASLTLPAYGPGPIPADGRE